MIGARRNPQRGTHADLFADQSATSQPTPAKNLWGEPIGTLKVPAGHTPVFAPITGLSAAELEQFPRAAFSNEEWGELPAAVQSEIENNDVASQVRVDKAVDFFLARWEWAIDPASKDFSHVEEQFEDWLHRRAATLYEIMPDREFDALVELGQTRGLTEEAVTAIINEALADTNQYVFNPSERERGDYQHKPVWSEYISADFYAPFDDYWEVAKHCTPDEAERVLAIVRKKTYNDVDIKVKQLRNRDDISLDWETSELFPVYAQWLSIVEACEEAINEADVADDFDKPGTAPPEARVLYRWADGFYVLDLVPSELLAEGKAMGMCVGRPDMGYGKAVRDGEIKILSLRRPSGKPLFTIEATLVQAPPSHPRHGVIDGIDQIKGKANRLPGFDIGKNVGATAKDMKKDEVERVFEFVELGTPVTVDDIDDLRPSRIVVGFLYMNGDAWATELVEKVGLDQMWPRPASLKKDAEREAEIATEYERDRATLRGNPSCSAHGDDCGGFCQPYRRRR